MKNKRTKSRLSNKSIISIIRRNDNFVCRNRFLREALDGAVSFLLFRCGLPIFDFSNLTIDIFCIKLSRKVFK